MSYIEYKNINTGLTEKQEVTSCFYCGHLDGNEKRSGSCIGLQIPHKTTKESEEFWNKIHGPFDSSKETPIAYFCNENCRIPFYIFDGNGYDESYGSSCLFGYVNPFLFSSKERPLRSQKTHDIGSYIMGFYSGPDRSKPDGIYGI